MDENKDRIDTIQEEKTPVADKKAANNGKLNDDEFMKMMEDMFGKK